MTMLQHSNGYRTISLTIAGLLAMSGGLAVAQDEASDSPELKISDIGSDNFDTFNIQVQDTELVKVLEMLALQAERNVIPSRNVAAVVSVNLFDVTFEESLDAILTPNGFAYEESSNGKFIYVYTQEELQRKQQLERTTEARMFELEHLSAGDAAKFATPLLSERGKLSFIGDVEGGIERDFTNMGRDDWAHSAILVVNDYPENLSSIAHLLGEIDTAPKQVVIDATIASVMVNEADGFGVDFSVIADLNYSGLLNPMSVVSDMLRGNKEVPAGYKDPGTPVVTGSQAVGLVSNPGNVADGPSTFKLGVMTGDASVFIRAMDQVTDTVVLARPRLMALNRQRAQVLVGRREPYLSTTSTDTTSTQTVQYLDTGVKLMFRPFISKDGSIRMELYPSVSKASPVQVTGGLESIFVPAEDTNEISTNVRVNDGETLVLGGLFQEETTITNRQVPFLGDIPIVGAAFTGYDNTVTRREIIFLITPTIVHDELVRRSGELGQSFVRELRVGTREGLLPWSRERRSAQHNQDALQAINAGEFELAMFHVDNSLRLNPGQPKMKHLRNKISEDGDVEYYDADMWDSALSDMLREHRKVRNEAESNPEDAPKEEPPAAAPVNTDDTAQESTTTPKLPEEPTVAKASPAISALLAELEDEEDLFVGEEEVPEERTALALEPDSGGQDLAHAEDFATDAKAADPINVSSDRGEEPEVIVAEAPTERALEPEDFVAEAPTERALEPEVIVAEAPTERALEPEVIVAEAPTERALEPEVIVAEAPTERALEPEDFVAEAPTERALEPEVNQAEEMLVVAEETEMIQTEAMPEVAEETVKVAEAPQKTTEETPQITPRESSWLRVWWLAGLAAEDAHAFARAEEKARKANPSGSTSSALAKVAEVNEDED